MAIDGASRAGVTGVRAHSGEMLGRTCSTLPEHRGYERKRNYEHDGSTARRRSKVTREKKLKTRITSTCDTGHLEARGRMPCEN